MWYDQSVIYQIYPLGYVGAPSVNDGTTEHRILTIKEHIPHFKKLGINTIYFCPVFDSSTHGYDTADYSKIDCRLGTNEDFQSLCNELHKNNIRIILDGVFNHVGRDFFAFKDVQQNKYNSAYKDWFFINFDGNSQYNDGFYYEGWEGHYELVKLNLDHPDVKNYLFNCIRQWISEFKIDGLRLDVAYMLNKNFMRELRQLTQSINPEFFLVGEMIHGDYNSIVNNEMCHSATNYECYKGIYSSLNEMNMFEISYSLNRQFGSENWCLYTGKNMVSFIDNHDVTRIASALTTPQHLNLAFGLLFTMPGIPCVYYGSEWGIEGSKDKGDSDLRPAITKPVFNDLSQFIAKLSSIRTSNTTLAYGNLTNLHVTNHQYVFERAHEGKRIIVMLNASDSNYNLPIDLNLSTGTDLLTGKGITLSSPITLPPYSIQIIES
ncbi:MAG: maltodextrin glucosidase [Clostridiales bacterium]|nr:maltodextrin glucosidase [Clostridiales bacterium]